MSIEAIKGLKESPEIKLNQGVDELAAVTDIGFNKVLEMSNFRVSEDGERCEKRDGVEGGEKLFVAVAASGTENRIMTSPDGETWTSRTTPAVGKDWHSITYGGGLFVCVAAFGTGNRVMTSPDGVNWTLRTTPADNGWRSVTYGNELFVAVASTGVGNRVMTSPDGITWTLRTSAADNYWRSVTYGNELFVAVASTGVGNRVMTSPDGITWTIGESAADNEWNSVVYADGLFVAVAGSGTGNRVMTSPDGVNWTIRASAANYTWRSVTYGNDLFVAIANESVGYRVMTSPNGIDWTIRSSAADNDWRSVTYGNGLFVAVARTGTDNRVMTSPDGENWTIRTSAANNQWYSVVYADGLTPFGDKKVFGYHTYYNTTPAFCQLAITEDEVWRKIGAADWISIHTWASTLDHPVKVLDIQGKQIIVTEIENIMILPSGTKVQLGISAPTTLPTIAAEYLDLDLDEDCAEISDWDNADAENGVSSKETFDSKTCFKFWAKAGAGDIARRRYDLAQIGADYTFETSIYFDEFGIVSDSDYFEINIYNGRIQFRLRVDAQGVYVYDGANWKTVLGRRVRVRKDKPRLRSRRQMSPRLDEEYDFREEREVWRDRACPLAVKDAWKTLKIAIKSSDPDNETCEVFIDEKAMGEYPCGNKDTTNSGRIELAAYGDTVATIVYTDWIKLKSADVKTGNLKGTYRYAVKYARSGNYPNESNPIKSVVGSAVYNGNGVGLDDLTPGGTYTGDEDITIRVQIDGTGATDTIKWSDDGGQTWNSELIPLTSTVYLPFGIELAWEAITGHTVDDYWEFTCNSLTVSPVNQKVELSDIPTSDDTGQVDQRKIYRTQPGGASYYLVATINDNTTTTFIDNIPDAVLGAPMGEDNDIAPLGKYSEWWDGRLWIAVETENIVYYSKTWVPDAFDTNNLYVSARRGISDDEIMNIIDYRSLLYIFKRSGITFVRKKLVGGYGVYDGPGTNGCIAPWSLLEAYGLLMYMSFRGWEVFNGEDSFSILFSKPVMNTVKSLDKTKAEYVMAARLQSKDEILLSIPDRAGSASAVTVVLNKARLAFYTFSFSKVPSCLCEVRDSSKEIQLIMGTRDGYIGVMESGTQDFGTNITATIRTGWWKFPIYQNFPMTEVEYECPTDKTLTVDHYVNFDKDSQRQEVLTGATPTATDQSIRLPIKQRIKTAIRGKYLAFKFSNAEDVGSAVKLNWFKQFYAPLPRKAEIKGD